MNVFYIIYFRVTKYGVRITKSGVNAFFEGVFIISFLLHEFFKHNVIKWNTTSKKIVMLM